jgi:hypothetical protein
MTMTDHSQGVSNRERRPRTLVARRILHGDRGRLVGRRDRRLVVVAFVVARWCLARVLAG